MQIKSSWFVYILRCGDDSLYTGITTDIKRRVIEHNTDKKGAKYTRARRPVVLAYSKKYKTRSEAAIAEAALKKLPRLEKMKLLGKGKKGRG